MTKYMKMREEMINEMNKKCEGKKLIGSYVRDFERINARVMEGYDLKVMLNKMKEWGRDNLADDEELYIYDENGNLIWVE